MGVRTAGEYFGLEETSDGCSWGETAWLRLSLVKSLRGQEMGLWISRTCQLQSPHGLWLFTHNRMFNGDVLDGEDLLSRCGCTRKG